MKEVGLIYFNHHLYNSQTMRSHEHARTHTRNQSF